MDDLISRQAVKELAHKQVREKYCGMALKEHRDFYIKLTDSIIDLLPTIQPEQRTGKWILDRSGAYCCSECMEPCAGYVMMKPRDKFCKMCGSRNEVTE